MTIKAGTHPPAPCPLRTRFYWTLAQLQGCVVIFLSNFLALLIKADTAGEGSQSFLGGVMVTINVLLILAVLFAACLTTQQAVDDHFDGNNAVTVAGAMLTFEQRTAANARSARDQVVAPISSVQTRRGCTDGVDGFNQSGGLSASIRDGLPHGLLVGGTGDTAIPAPTVPPVTYSASGEERGRGFIFLARSASGRIPRARISPEITEESSKQEHDPERVHVSHPGVG